MERISLAEKMVGIKAKTFLMSSLYEYAKKLSLLNANWAEITSELIHNSISSSFSPDEKRLEEQTITFLQWLGFSPVDLKWNSDLKIAQIYIGTSRIWREDPRADPVSGVVMKALISGLGVNFFHEKPQVEFIEENLPPRTLYGFELTERFGELTPMLKGDISNSQKDGSNSKVQTNRSMISSTKAIIRKIKPIVEPVLGNSISSDDAAKELFEATRIVLQNHYPDITDLNADMLLLLFQRSAKDEQWEKFSVELGKVFAVRVKTKYSNLSPNAALKGLGALDPTSIDELLFSGKHTHQSKVLCQFIANIWNELINAYMPIEFLADKPLCANSGSNMCLFAFIPK